MNIKFYKKVCKFCDKILLSKKSSIFTHSVTSLHVLKEHPVVMDSYFDFNHNRKKDGDQIKKKFLFYVLEFFMEKKNFKLNKHQIKGADVLILSNLINQSHIFDKYDFYFGKLEQHLNQKKIKTFTILRNFTNASSSNLITKLKKNKILLFKKTFLYREIYIVYKIFTEFLLLNFNFNKPKIPNLKNILSLFSMRSMVYNLRLQYQIKDLIKTLKPKLLIIPFEGHAWERVLIKSVKNSNTNVKVAAYQFTITTKYQHSLFRPLKSDYNPDYILSSGSITKKKFEKYYNCPIKIFGSNKYKNNKIKKKTKKNNFLVVPEAFQSEMEFMLKFTINCAKLYSNYKFIFRVHPLMKSNILKEKVKNYNNIFLSDSSFDEDLENCKYIFFRGSAAVFEAINSGLKPIYLKKKNEFDINPLHDIFPNILNAFNEKDIKKIINYFNSKKMHKSITNYSNKFFSKPNFNAIELLLNNQN